MTCDQCPFTLPCAQGVLTVYVLTYHHRHGEDISLYWSYAEAEQGIANIMTTYLDELDAKEQRRVKQLLKKQEFDAARTIWEQQLDETFFVNERQLPLPGVGG